jgi:S-adenosylmethionine:tRNA ribosyltransferase-isomerase
MTKNSITTRLSSYDYNLPKNLIAQEPLSNREQAKLLVLNKMTGATTSRHFFDLPKILKAGDVLVFNNSKVIPARLNGKKETGGQVEIFLLTKQQRQVGNYWHCLIGGKVNAGQEIFLDNKVIAVPLEKIDNKVWLVKFSVNDQKLFSVGEVPLPPYIKKKSKMSDYQNVYAKSEGSVAAPTAGLHFSQQLLKKLKEQGVQLEFVTLHVGLGTFLSVETEDILEHKMHSEWAELDQTTAQRLNSAKQEGRRIIAVGTTAVRVLESFSNNKGQIKASNGWLDIFIYPGYQFKFVEALITNFHLPKSTLLMLVSAFAGREQILQAYQEAIAKKYRFFSFGDGMLIE